MVIGITGNFGAGKTTVARMFKHLGAAVIDADKIAHQLIQPQSKIYKQIVIGFGRDILAGKRISRKRLARLVFSDTQALRKLNAILHPAIIKIIKKKIRQASRNEILVVDAALLIEAGLLSWVDRLIVVNIEPKVQKERLIKKGFSQEEIERRLSMQIPQKEKTRLADFVIDNNGTMSQTRKQVKGIFKRIQEG